MHAVVRGALGVLEGEGSILLLQSRLLLAVFEVGHGLVKSASTTVATLARAVDFLSMGSLEPAQKGQVDLLWRGVLILDRYVE